MVHHNIFFLECELKNYYLLFEPAFTGIKKKNLNPTTGMFYASLHLARATWNQFSYCIGCSRKEEQTHDDKWLLVYSTKGKPWRRIRNSATHTDHRSNISGIKWNLVKHPQTHHLTQFVTHKYFHKYDSKNGKSDKGEAMWINLN